jgi:hypothetical protein
MMTTTEKREEKRRLDRQLHLQLDQIVELSRKLLIARPLCQNALELQTLDLLRRIVLLRLAQIKKTVNKQRPAKKDGWLGEEGTD